MNFFILVVLSLNVMPLEQVGCSEGQNAYSKQEEQWIEHQIAEGPSPPFMRVD